MNCCLNLKGKVMKSTLEKFNRAYALQAAAASLKAKALVQLEEATKMNVRAFQMDAEANDILDEAQKELQAAAKVGN